MPYTFPYMVCVVVSSSFLSSLQMVLANDVGVGDVAGVGEGVGDGVGKGVGVMYKSSFSSWFMMLRLLLFVVCCFLVDVSDEVSFDSQGLVPGTIRMIGFCLILASIGGVHSCICTIFGL